MDSDDELEESSIYVNFKFFSEIHGVMRGRPSVSPPALLDTSLVLLLRALQHLSRWWSHLLLLVSLDSVGL